MFDFDARLHQIAAFNKGVVTVVAALAAGIPLHAIDDRVRAGVLIPMHRGVYRHAAAPFTQDLRDLAAVLACGTDSVLSHRSAAARHEWADVRRAKPEVTSPHRDLPLVAGVTVHRSLRLAPCEVITKNGIRMTSRGRTALDFCAVTPLEVSQEVISKAVIMKRLKPEEIIATLERSGGRGCPGTANLRAIAMGLDEIEKLESVLELVVARIIDALSVPRATRQLEMTCADGRNVRLDFAWVPERIALEPAGRRWHATPATKRATAARRRSIVETGWIHLECGWAEAHDTPDDIRTDVLSAFAERTATAA